MRLDKEVKLMQLARIIIASAFLFGAGCVLPEEGNQPNDLTSLDGQSEEVAYENEATDDASDESMASSDGEEAIWEEDDPLGDKAKWTCWVCHKDKDGKGGDKCPEEHCYHGKHKKKDKAKDKAWEECKDDHKHGCYFKECKKFY
jgi:hypothetical protein